MKDVNYLIRDLEIIGCILGQSQETVEADFLRIDRLKKYIKETALQSTRKPPVDTIAVPREVLQGVRGAIQYIRIWYEMPDIKQANEALASLDAVLAEGE